MITHIPCRECSRAGVDSTSRKTPTKFQPVARRPRREMTSCQLAALKARLEREPVARQDDDVVPGIVVALLIARKESGR